MLKKLFIFLLVESEGFQLGVVFLLLGTVCARFTAYSRDLEIILLLRAVVVRCLLYPKIFVLRTGRTDAVDEIIEKGSSLATSFIKKSNTIRVDDSEIHGWFTLDSGLIFLDIW